MIRQNIEIKSFDWNVTVLYDISCSDSRGIISALEDLGCQEEMMEEALEYIDHCKQDCGITYTNITNRKTLIIIFRCSSKCQLYNTCVHELYHFIRQLSIAEYSSEEDQATLIGNMFMEMQEPLRDLINLL